MVGSVDDRSKLSAPSSKRSSNLLNAPTAFTVATGSTKIDRLLFFFPFFRLHRSFALQQQLQQQTEGLVENTEDSRNSRNMNYYFLSSFFFLAHAIEDELRKGQSQSFTYNVAKVAKIANACNSTLYYYVLGVTRKASRDA